MVLEPSDFAALQDGGAAQRKTYLQKRARAAKPVELPDVAKKAVLNAISGQVVQPLPANINVLHALQRGATSSVVQANIASWLDSEEGIKWKAERGELFRGGCEEKDTTA